MKLSHSKLQCIINNPAEYYLSAVEGIQLKEEKAAFAIGSAVHWSIEHDTDDLLEYFGKSSIDELTQQEIMAIAMAHGFKVHKDKIMSKVLEGCTIEEENHELFLTSNLPSIPYDHHEFVGILDLLCKTDKGWILMDYKTSSQTPDWKCYIDQIYRYIFQLKTNFPDIPIYRLGIINIKKSSLYKRKDDTNQSFLDRYKQMYETDFDKLFDYHEFKDCEIDLNDYDKYIRNLKYMSDIAASIVANKSWFINFNNVEGKYGKSDYYPIFFRQVDAYKLYKIRDKVYMKDQWFEERGCCDLDMKVLFEDNVLNHFYKFEQEYEKDREHYLDNIKQNYIVDDRLLKIYENTLQQKLKESSEEIKDDPF